jgi:Uma2 family endonuclease
MEVQVYLCYYHAMIGGILPSMKGWADMTTTEKVPMVTPADWVPGPGQGQWTYDDYAALPDDGKRYEVVSGVLYMTPSPSGAHQDAVFEIASYLRTHIKLTGLGLVRVAPFDVVLSPKDVVQPDVLVILNASLDKVKDDCITGAPDLVVEVASPGTATRDRNKKYHLYAQAGVPEYWIADPDARTVEVLALEAGEYHSLGVYRGKAILPSRMVPGFDVHVEQFFS